MEKWYYFPIQTAQNVEIKMPRRFDFAWMRIGLVNRIADCMPFTLRSATPLLQLVYYESQWELVGWPATDRGLENADFVIGIFMIVRPSLPADPHPCKILRRLYWKIVPFLQSWIQPVISPRRRRYVRIKRLSQAGT